MAEDDSRVPTEPEPVHEPEPGGGRPSEVLGVFLRLGLSSFGGPIAHLGYFRRELVERRRWVDESRFAQLLVLCQFLPGPASSQLGFGLGLLRAGWAGALAAFVGFTLPSAVLLVAFAALLPSLSGPVGAAAVHGLKLVALAVVAHGVSGMARRLCPDAPRASIAAAAAVGVLLFESAWAQLAVVVFGALAGVWACRDVEPVNAGAMPLRYGPRLGWCLILVFAVLLLILPLAAVDDSGVPALAESFYRAGALVFGGGHVVLPLLEETVVRPDRLTADEFLAGYGAAQAVPGPMFSLSAYLGARMPGELGGVSGALVALVSIFLPGFLLLGGVLPLWTALASSPAAARVVAGVNAAVVGLLAAALYDPVWTSAVRGPVDLSVALVGFVLFAAWRVSALWVVVWCVTASVAAAQLM